MSVFDIPTKQTGDTVSAQEINDLVAAGKSYKAYLATIAQPVSGEDPVVTVLNSGDFNYLGDIVWTRATSGRPAMNGVLIGTLAGAFPEGQTIMPPFGNGNSALQLPLSFISKGYYQLTTQGDGDTLILWTFADLDSTLVEFAAIGGSIFIDVKVYQV